MFSHMRNGTYYMYYTYTELCHSTDANICLYLVLYCVGDLNPLPASTSVGRVVMPRKQSLVFESHPGQLFLKKRLL